MATRRTITTKRVDRVSIENRGRSNVARQFGLGVPFHLAGVRMQAPKLARHGDNKFIVFRDQGWCVVCGFIAACFRLPLLFACPFVERVDSLVFIRGIHNLKMVMQNWACSGTPLSVARFLANFDVPLLVTVEVNCIDAHLAKEGIDHFSVGDRGAARVAVLGDVAPVRVFASIVADFESPLRIPSGAVDTVERPFDIL